MSFAALAQAVAKVTTAEASLKAAQEAGARARYAAKNVRVEAQASNYGGAIHEEAVACAESLKWFRDNFAKGAELRATEAAIARQIALLEEARATIPHLVAAAMVDLGGQLGALRAVVLVPGDAS